MDFREASDRATDACITLADIAGACGVSSNAIRRARVTTGGDSYRSPPAGWEGAVAELAEKRAQSLQDLARELRETVGEG